MNVDTPEKERIYIHDMFIQRNRLMSFKDWVFDENCACTPEKMAAAGFYHCPTDQEPDLVRCFVCHKELDGWDSTDDPWQEHVKHSKHCPFLSLPDPSHITVEEAMKLNRDRYRTMFEKVMTKKIQELQDFAEVAVKQMKTLY